MATDARKPDSKHLIDRDPHRQTPGLRKALLWMAVLLAPTGAFGAPHANTPSEQGPAPIISVTGPEMLREILDTPELFDGAILDLAPGQYGPVRLRGPEMPAAIRSADPENPAVLSRIQMRDFDGLTVENLVFDYRFQPEHPPHLRPFRFRDCSNLTISGNRFIGDTTDQRDAEGRFPAFAFGLSVGRCENVTVANNHISVFSRALLMGDVHRARVVNNEITQIATDGMNFAQVAHLEIAGNTIHNFPGSLAPDAHGDMIQFWTNGADWASHDVTIRGNTLLSGEGRHTQSIFIRNDQVDRGVSGMEMYYRNFLIEENVIINAHRHGISVGEVMGLTIRNNTIAQNIHSAGPNPERALWVPRIRVSPAARDVVIERNIAPAIGGFEGQFDWQVRDNLLIQNTGLLDDGIHYSLIFEGAAGSDPSDIQNFLYRRDGPAYRLGIGASDLQPPSPQARALSRVLRTRN